MEADQWDAAALRLPPVDGLSLSSHLGREGRKCIRIDARRRLNVLHMLIEQLFAEDAEYRGRIKFRPDSYFHYWSICRLFTQQYNFSQSQFHDFNSIKCLVLSDQQLKIPPKFILLLQKISENYIWEAGTNIFGSLISINFPSTD